MEKCLECENTGEADKKHLLDATLPGMDGPTVIRFMCKRHSPSKHDAWVTVDAGFAAVQALMSTRDEAVRVYRHERQRFIKCRGDTESRDSFANAMLAKYDAQTALEDAVFAYRNKRLRTE